MKITRLRFLALAVTAALLAAAPASVSATELAAEPAYVDSVAWQKHWGLCFKDRPADRIAAMRATDVLLELSKVARQNAVDRKNEKETPVPLYDARINQMIDDFESVENLGCGAAQVVMAVFNERGVGRIHADRLESLKWATLAEKSGSEAAQKYLKKILQNYHTEEIAEAHAWVDAWRPSD